MVCGYRLCTGWRVFGDTFGDMASLDDGLNCIDKLEVKRLSVWLCDFTFQREGIQSTDTECGYACGSSVRIFGQLIVSVCVRARERMGTECVDRVPAVVYFIEY